MNFPKTRLHLPGTAAEQAWIVIRAYCRPLLNSLRIKSDPATGAELAESLASFIGVDARKGSIPEVESGGALGRWVQHRLLPNVKNLLQEYGTFRTRLGLNQLVVDVRVAQALSIVSNVMDEYRYRQSITEDSSIQAVNLASVALLRGCMGFQRNAPVDFRTFRHLAATGRCDGLVTFLGPKYLFGSLVRVLRSPGKGVKAGEVVDVLRDFVRVNFTTPTGGLLLHLVADAIIKSRWKPESKLRELANAELEKFYHSRVNECVALVSAAEKSLSPVGSDTLHFFANCLRHLPRDLGQRILDETLKVSPKTGLECAFFGFDAIKDLKTRRVVLMKVAKTLQTELRNVHSPLRDINDPTRVDTWQIPPSRTMVSCARSINVDVIDELLPDIADRTQVTAREFMLFVALRLQAEGFDRRQPLSMEINRGTFITMIVKSLGLFQHSKSLMSDEVLLQRLIENGSVTRIARDLGNLAAYFSPAQMRKVAQLYVNEESASPQDLGALVALAGQWSAGRSLPSLAECSTLSDVERMISGGGRAN